MKARSHSNLCGTGWSSGMHKCVGAFSALHISPNSQFLTFGICAPPVCSGRAHLSCNEQTFFSFWRFHGRSRVPAGSCTVWNMESKLTGRCVRTTTSTMIRMPSSAAATVTRPKFSSVCLASFWSTSSPFPLTRYARAATDRSSTRVHSSRARKTPPAILDVATTVSDAS